MGAGFIREVELGKYGIQFERSHRDPFAIHIRVPEEFMAKGFRPEELLVALRNHYHATVLKQMRDHRHVRQVILRAKRDKQTRIGRMVVVKRLQRRQ